MKKRNFVLTGIALGLSVFATSLSAQAAIPNEIVEQGSLAPMLEKAQARSCDPFWLKAKQKQTAVSALPDDIPEEFKFSLVINLANNLVEIVVHHATSEV